MSVQVLGQSHKTALNILKALSLYFVIKSVLSLTNVVHADRLDNFKALLTISSASL